MTLPLCRNRNYFTESQLREAAKWLNWLHGSVFLEIYTDINYCFKWVIWFYVHKGIWGNIFTINKGGLSQINLISRSIISEKMCLLAKSFVLILVIGLVTAHWHVDLHTNEDGSCVANASHRLGNHCQEECQPKETFCPMDLYTGCFCDPGFCCDGKQCVPKLRL